MREDRVLARLCLTIWISWVLTLLAACQTSEGATLVLREGKCLYQGPQGITGSNFTITFNKQMEREDLVVVFATVKGDFEAAELRNYRDRNLGEFTDQVLASLPAPPGRTVTEKVRLLPGEETVIACATKAGVVFSVVAVLTPR